jgi:hypothetical protein
MTNVKILLLALPLCAAVACKSGTATLAEPYHISFETSGADVAEAFPTMSDLVDSIEYVKLEHVPDMPVGHVDYLCFGEDYMFVFDGDAGLLHYTRDGRFVRRVGHIGRGPGEYSPIISGLWVDRAGGTIHFVSGDRVLRYELATGRFIGEAAITGPDGSPMAEYSSIEEFPPPADGIAFASRGGGFTMSVFAPTSPAWLALDVPAARIIYREPSAVYNEGNTTAMTVLLPQPMWTNPEGVVTTYENGADTMFTVNADMSRTPRIVADLGPGRFRVPVAQGDSGVAIDRVLESGNHILFTLVDGVAFGSERPKITLMSFDKRTGARAFATQSDDWFFEGPVNDIDGGGGTARLREYDKRVKYTAYDAFRMVDKLTPEHFAQVRPAVRHPERLDRLQAFVSTLTEDDNPVVAIFHLKK